MYTTRLRCGARIPSCNGASGPLSSLRARGFLNRPGAAASASFTTATQGRAKTILPTRPNRTRTCLAPPLPLQTANKGHSFSSTPTNRSSDPEDTDLGTHFDFEFEPPKDIAILGAGLTGLTTAWYLTQNLPDANITIYEASDRVGGWVDTDKVEVTTPEGEKGVVYFERGPRMIKPQTSGRVPKWDDLVFFDLVTQLKLGDQLMHMKKSEESVAGFIYYPDHLVPLPKPPPKGSGAWAWINFIRTVIPLAFEDLFSGVFSDIRGMLVTQQNALRTRILERREDVSMGDYLTARLGRPDMVNKFVSAGVHGIMGGDVWKQSMATGFAADSLIPDGEDPEHRAWTRVTDYNLMETLTRDEAVFDLATEHLDTSALWFRNGFTTLPNAIADALRKNPRVNFRMSEPITNIKRPLKKSEDSEDRLEIESKPRDRAKTSSSYDKVISTITAKALSQVTSPSLPSLEDAPAVSIMVVNIWYPELGVNAPYHGFGYLLPQAVPYSENPEWVLGVIFDSEREAPLPTVSNPDPPYRGADTVPGTKLTVMMGGHYWDQIMQPPKSENGKPEWQIDRPALEEQAKKNALAAVQRHLKLDPALAAQAHVSARLCYDCIPQHVVGHRDRMQQANYELESNFGRLLSVVGHSFQNPGVLGMLRAGFDVAAQVSGQEIEDMIEDENPWPIGATGLGRFAEGPSGELWVACDRRRLPLRFNSGARPDPVDPRRMPREDDEEDEKDE